MTLRLEPGQKEVAERNTQHSSDPTDVESTAKAKPREQTDGHKPFEYDAIERPALDVAVIVAYHIAEGQPWVWLRSAARPPLAFRPSPPHSPAPPTPVLWEVAAGLIEPGESPAEAAAREAEEELGFQLYSTSSRLRPREAAADGPVSTLVTLGPPAFPAPALIAEAHYFFMVEVNPDARRAPQGDGSAIEQAGEVICVPLAEALDACRRGDVPDAKTELALRRLHDQVGSR